MSNHDNENDYNQPNKPFNDAIDHLNTIEGNPMKSETKMSQLPKGIRLIGYVFIACFILFIVAALIGNMLY
ncbi:hypothetical protein LG329_14580 [Virgibacillus necropolis]|uniref:hypothetical protein n=1 Tax=Virgibacillus necropolis TaxID=163877 RepID=UPI00384BEEA6